jgi:hypothetical protein
VGDPDAGVEDVDDGALARVLAVVEGAVEARARVDAVDAPRRVLLERRDVVELDDAVGDDRLDLVLPRPEARSLAWAQGARDAWERKAAARGVHRPGAN